MLPRSKERKKSLTSMEMHTSTVPTEFVLLYLFLFCFICLTRWYTCTGGGHMQDTRIRNRADQYECRESVFDVITGERFRCSATDHTDNWHEAWSEEGIVVARWRAPHPIADRTTPNND